MTEQPPALPAEARPGNEDEFQMVRKPTEDEVDRLEKAAWDANVDQALVWYRDEIERLKRRTGEQVMAAFDKFDAPQMAQTTPWFTRVLLWVFARRLNRDVFYRVLGRAYERRVINSEQLHTLHAQFDPTQRGFIGQIARDAII